MTLPVLASSSASSAIGSLDDLRQRYALTSEEASDLASFDELLVSTTARTNLIARSTLPDRWSRHYEDALQIWPLLPEGASSLLDVGSGGGFPGIPLAILAKHRRPSLRLTLVDSVGKKAAFLEEGAEAAGLAKVTVRAERVEALTEAKTGEGSFDVVTARAVASLPKLLRLCAPHLASGGLLIALKGRRAAEEVEDAKSSWRFLAERVDSHTDPEASILLIRDVEEAAERR